MSAPPLDLTELMSHARWIRRLARTLVADPHTADDLVQETWIAAIRHPPARPVTRPWLARVLHNLARQQARGEASRDRRERTCAVREELPSSSELLERAEVQRLLVEAVVALEEPYRSTLLMRFYEDLSSAEIARRGGVADSTVRARVHRGLELLRRKLDAQHGGDRRAWCAALVPLLAVPLPGPPQSAEFGGRGKVVATTAVLAGGVIATALVVSWVEPEAESQPSSVATLVPSSSANRRAPGARGEGQDAPVPEPGERQRLSAGGGEDPGAGVDGGSAAAGAPVRGRVVDAATGDPVPHYSFHLFDGAGRSVLLASDERGEFETEGAWPRGPLKARLVDHPDAQYFNRVESWEHGGPGAADVELPVRPGPTYRLDLEPPAGLGPEDFVAMLAQNLHSIHAEGDEVSFGTSVRAGDSGRAGSPAWARFAPLAVANTGAGPPWELEVVSRDGLWTGSVPVSRRDGVDETVHRIELVPRGAVSGRILDPAGDGVWNASLTLSRSEPSPSWFTARAATGAYRIRALEAGAYTLTARADGYEIGQCQVQVTVGQAAEVDLVLQPAATVGRIAGVVRSETGGYDRSVAIRLSSGGPAATSFVEWVEEDGDLVGYFTFDGVAAPGPGQASYRLTAQRKDLFAWEGAEQEVEPGHEDVELLVHDDVETFAFGFRVVDGQTGEPFTLATVKYGVGTQRSGDEVAFGEIVLDEVPVDAALEWSVRPPGYAPVSGTAAELEVEGDRRFATVHLERGWGARFYLLAPEPVPGATLAFDGLPYGTFGPEGWLDVSLPDRPQRLSIEADGWTIEPTSVLERDGTFDDTHWTWLPIYLRRCE